MTVGAALTGRVRASAVEAIPPASASVATIASTTALTVLISPTLPIVDRRRRSVSCEAIMKAEPDRSMRAGTATVSNSGQTLGERVRAARRETGLSQAQLAGDELTKGFISQIESGLVRPSIRSLQHIASTLGRPLDYFIADEPLAATKRVTFHRLAAEAAAERLDWPSAGHESAAGLAVATDAAERATFLRLLAS